MENLTNERSVSYANSPSEILFAYQRPKYCCQITSYLEQRCYKDLRSEQFQSVKIVMLIYRNLLIHCKEKMSMFSGSLLSIINILLDQTRHDEIRVLGCVTLAEFVSNQTDDTYILNLDGIIPKLCLLAQEIGEDGKGQHLCSAGLQALSTMVIHPHAITVVFLCNL
ncbi:hypothetical protein Pint_23979 [Pistacia integerrima]|uniref:Uncharacterized protein n=1 Tax=Pistacia integerrima TaxID=434235 RepID=A0ACC0YHL2_9ROSI|nr:hypothetical protein Pint_23979 [Pistacia integerrima]